MDDRLASGSIRRIRIGSLIAVQKRIKGVDVASEYRPKVVAVLPARWSRKLSLA